MKRSEAVEIIRKILSKHEDDQLIPIHYIDSLSCELLCGVEESIGMIPPNQYACTNEFRFEWEEE